LNAGTATFVNTSNSGTLGIGGLATFVNSSNTGTFGVAGVATHASNIVQTAAGAFISNAGIFSNASNVLLTGGATSFLSNSGILSNTGAGAFFLNTSNTGTLGVNGITTHTGQVNTTSISNSGNISTNTLNVGQISTIYINSDNAESRLLNASESVSFPEAIIYDSNTFSTGTFRYSTLTTLFSLPDTSLLYFNNLVIGGAYVWPGQTISALDYTGLYEETIITTFSGAGRIGIPASAASNTFSRTIFSNVTGGTPPYAVVMDPNTLMTDVKVGFGSLDDNNAGVNLTNTSSIITGSTSGPTNVTFTLIDSSTPRFVRSVVYSYKVVVVA
jgi:hypothetical protein